MGWDYYTGKTQDYVVAKLLKGWTGEGVECRVVEHTRRPGILWTVNELTKGETVKRFIGCDLLEGNGVKSLSEAMHPYYYDCPLAYLEMAPVECQEWRDKVKAYWAEETTTCKAV